MRDVRSGSAWDGWLFADNGVTTDWPRGDRIGKPIRRETVRPDERPAVEPRPVKTPDKVPVKTPVPARP